MTPAPPAEVASYAAGLSGTARLRFEEIRAIVLDELEGAAETISYRIPAYKVGGRIVVYVAAWKAHCALYPMEASVLDELGAAAEGRASGVATLRLPHADPVPDTLIRAALRLRLARITAAGTPG
jgi:uncharacterized protein YdhG (YjbR/CyaY superfamily)